MADRDKFEIELGITEAGAAGKGSSAGRVGSSSSGSGYQPLARSRAGIGDGAAVGGRASRGEARADRFIKNRLFEDPAKGITRYAIAESLSHGFQSLMPNADHNAFTEVGKIAGDIGMRSIFLNSLKGGAIIGGLSAAISLVQRSIELMTRRVEEIERDRLAEKEKLREINARVERSFAKESDLTANDIKEIRENLWNSELSPI